jgi:hypothetical protein
MCIILPETDEGRERNPEIVIVETDAIIVQVRDEDVDAIIEDGTEPSVIEENTTQINYISFDDPNIPKAVMVGVVV